MPNSCQLLISRRPSASGYGCSSAASAWGLGRSTLRPSRSIDAYWIAIGLVLVHSGMVPNVRVRSVVKPMRPLGSQTGPKSNVPAVCGSSVSAPVATSTTNSWASSLASA